MSKIIKFNNEAKEKMQIGMNLLANAVRVTLGPKGRYVVIGDSTGYPQVTKDGVSVAMEITLEDPFENMGAQLIKQAASRTAEIAGDGTTTATVLAQFMINKGLNLVKTGCNPVDIKTGIEYATKQIVSHIADMSMPVGDDFDKIMNVAAISANNDLEIGKLISDAMKIVTIDGVVSLGESKTAQTYVDLSMGMEYDRGYISPYFINDRENNTTVFENPLILIINKRISAITEIQRVVEYIFEVNKPALIICDDMEGDALAFVTANVSAGNVQICVIKNPGFGKYQLDHLQDISIATNASIVKDNTTLTNIQAFDFGEASSVTVSKDKVVIIAKTIYEDVIKQRAELLKANVETFGEDDEAIREMYKARIAKLAGGVAVIRVGGTTEVEMKEKKDRVDDALRSTRAAIKEGIIMGGGSAYAKIYKIVSDELITNPPHMTPDEIQGINIVYGALFTPIRTIVANAGVEDLNDEIFFDVAYDGFDTGYNAKIGKLTSMYNNGIIDPAMVTRAAIENASSVACMFLMIDCAIVEKLLKNTIS